MPDLHFQPLEQDDLDLLSAWFEDPQTHRWVEPPTPQWFRYVHDGLESCAWIVYDACQPVGLVQFDVKADKTGYIGLVTNTALRKRGYGKRMLQTLVKMQD